MAILNLGLSDEYPYTTSTVGCRVYENEDGLHGSAGKDIRLVWSTEEGTQTQKTFNFTIRWRARQKGVSHLSGWSTAVTAAVSATQCNERQPHKGGRVWWSHDLDIGGLLGQISGGGAWRYDTRVFDGMELQVSVYSTFQDDYAKKYGKTKSGTASASMLSINYVPVYEITSVYYETSDMVVIEYDTTWTRQDDRYAFEPDCRVVGYGASYPDVELELLGGGIGSALFRGVTWGTIAAPGRIEVPTSALTQHIKGKRVYLDIRFNAAYRPIELEFAHARGTYEVEDRTICNTPTIALTDSEDPYSVSVLTGDSGDLDAPIEQVTVKLAGGKYAADEVTVAPGDAATLRFPPLNRPFAVEAVGSRYGAVSAPAAAAAPAIATYGVTVLDSIEEGSRVVLQWNQTHDITSTSEREVVKLARRRPSAFYGTGGATAFSMQAVLIDEDGADIEALPEKGDVMVRIHDGRRYAIAMDAGISWEGPRIRTVSITGEEVDA